MAEYLIRDRLRDLWHQIDEHHLSYLQADESPRKIEEKKRLEGFIKDYLSIAPHENKFFFQETGQVLRKSVEEKLDFSAYRATAAWTAIAAYAHNLLAQPWRLEFREVKMYSGFYKHNVECCLIGGDVLLQMMGYRPINSSIMILEGPVDPDRVANVSKDSIMALVECQIMGTVYGELVKSGSSCTWLDVLQYRENHIANCEQAINGLSYHLSQRKFQDQRRSIDCYDSCHVPYDQCSYIPQYYRYQPNITAPQFTGVHPYTMPPSQLQYPSGLVSPQQPIASVCPMYSANGVHYGYPHNGYPPPPPPLQHNYGCSVPTGQLIELDVPSNTKEHAFINNSHRRSSSEHLLEPKERYSRYSANLDSYAPSRSSKEDGWESWGYVYQTLENKKIANKENSCPPNSSDKKTLSLIDLEDAFKGFNVNDVCMNPSGIEKKTSQKPEIRRKGKVEPSVVMSTQTLGREPLRSSVDNYRTLRVKLNDKWECVACTYHNPCSLEVCEMCGKSKTVGNEAQPLTSGGRQCPKCTLVNKKGVIVCDACGTSLKDSPTYI